MSTISSIIAVNSRQKRDIGATVNSMPIDYRFQPKGSRSKLGWYDRGYIPHFDGGEIPQFLTFRLFDSIPQTLLEQWREESRTQGEEGKMIFRKKVEKYLDRGYGECFLWDERVAEITQSSLLFYHEEKYSLQAWVVMPNHVHFLAMPFQNIELSEIAHSIKSYTAHEANKILNRQGQFWQHEPFDRYIRNEKHYVNVIKYIENNPVKAGLCKKPEDWQFSSTFYKLKKI
jgi:REP element-mobilizing transposase RayT